MNKNRTSFVNEGKAEISNTSFIDVDFVNKKSGKLIASSNIHLSDSPIGGNSRTTLKSKIVSFLTASLSNIIIGVVTAIITGILLYYFFGVK